MSQFKSNTAVRALALAQRASNSAQKAAQQAGVHGNLRRARRRAQLAVRLAALARRHSGKNSPIGWQALAIIQATQANQADARRTNAMAHAGWATQKSMQAHGWPT